MLIETETQAAIFLRKHFIRNPVLKKNKKVKQGDTFIR